MAKRPKLKRVRRELTRKEITHLSRQRKQQRLLIWSIVAVAVALVGVLGYGIVSETYLKARRPVAIVGGAPIRTDEFQARVRFVRLQMRNQIANLQDRRLSMNPDSSQDLFDYIDGQVRDLDSQLAPENASAIGQQVLQQLVNEQLVRQEAARRGVTVSPDEVQLEIEQGFGYDRNPEPTPSAPLTSTQGLAPTDTPLTKEQFDERYKSFVSQTLQGQDVPEPLYRTWLEAALLTGKVQEAMAAELPSSDDQIKVDLLSLATQDQAQEYLTRWNSGEEFQNLSDELANSQNATGYGQMIDWLPKDLWETQLGADVADMAFRLAPGERGGPLQGLDGRFYVIEVLGHEVRPLDEYVQQQRASESFKNWLIAQQAMSVEMVPYQPDIVPTMP